MTYNPLIPVNTDYMVVSQPQINSNFQAIYKAFTENHVQLNKDEPGASQGLHDFMTFRIQPDPTTSATQLALYTKIVSGDAALFFQPSSNQTPIQLTYPSISTGLASTNPDVYLTQQYSFVAGPFVVYMGHIAATDGQVVTLLPSTTLLYVGLTFFAGGGGGDFSSVCPTNIIGNTFKIRFGNVSFISPPQCGYIAIGKP